MLNIMTVLNLHYLLCQAIAFRWNFATEHSCIENSLFVPGKGQMSRLEGLGVLEIGKQYSSPNGKVDIQKTAFLCPKRFALLGNLQGLPPKVLPTGPRDVARNERNQAE